MSDKEKFVTIEMFEAYHKKLMEYIKKHDDLILNGETIEDEDKADEVTEVPD